MEDTLIAVLCIVLGLSFLYKAILAIFMGKTSYWEGFLPISIISPFFTHLPAGKNTLIKVKEAWYIHILLGPAFLLLSIGLLAFGADKMGMPGGETVNYVLTLGREDVPPAIIYDKASGYRFPIVKKAGDTIYKILTKPVFTDTPDMPPGQPTEQQQEASGGEPPH